ncbi:MAG TPA: LysE family transporter [Gaiellales bacterium]|nr:LysE family transporter [Gaiellales bacterium]
MTGTYRWDAAGSLVVTALAIMGTPGPATISLTAVGSAHGMRRSLGYLAGIVAGTTAVLLAVATGITAALLAVPAVRPVLIAAGAVYILWLAYHVATAPPLAQRGGAMAAPGVVGGALLGVANPKAWIAIAAVFASARLADGAAADATAKVAVLTGMIVVINAAWLAAGASLAPLLSDPRRARLVNRGLAAVLVAAAALAVRP